MGAQIQCPHCEQIYGLSDEQVPQYAGQTINCTQCQKAFTVPPDLAQQANLVAPAPAIAGVAPSRTGSAVNYATPGSHLQQKSNGMAIASVVCGASSMIVPILPAIPGIICGIIGLRRTRNPAVSGKGLAITGICLSAVGVVFMTGVILLPAVARARETVHRIKCAANLKAIGNALLLYANENRGQYPPNLEAVLLTQDITPHSFVCPASSDTLSPGTTAAEWTANLSKPGHLSYVYMPGMNSRATAEHVVVYEHLVDHGQEGGNFLFGDGHVEWISKPQAQQWIAQLQSGQNPPR